jgi:hypothetical protein
MISGQMIQSHARLYLNGKVSLDDFEDWLLSNSWNAHLDSDSSAVEVYHKIEGSLLDFSSGAIGIDSLHAAIEQSILPLERACDIEVEVKPPGAPASSPRSGR